MTDQVTISKAPQYAVCKAMCWLIGIAAGAYLAITLVNDFGLEQTRAAVLGIVAALLSGFVLRRILCRQRGSRVEIRVQEAAARAAAKDLTKKNVGNGRVPDHSAPRNPEQAHKKPEVTPTKETLKKRLLSEDAAKPVAPNGASDASSYGENGHGEKPASNPENASAPAATPNASQSAAPLVLGDTAKVAPSAEPIKGAPPKPLAAPENGTADELRKIDGIGVAEEKALHAAGIFHFSQFVAMNKRHLVWVDENIATGGQDQPSVAWRKQAIALSRKAKQVADQGNK